jgi:valyl-tRNA synthetase
MARGIKIASEIRSLRTKAGISKKSTAAVHLELLPQDSDFTHIIPAVETITNSQIILEPPLKTSRPNVITYSVDLRDGKSCRLSILQDGSLQPSATTNAAEENIKNLGKVMKLKAKLENLKDKLQNPEFLMFADEHSKNDLKKKMEQIKTKIAEINEGASSTKHH